MSHAIDSISIRGLRKAHLVQLASYIRARDSIGEQWYYGPRKHFEARHADLITLAEELERIAANDGIVIASNATGEFPAQKHKEKA